MSAAELYEAGLALPPSARKDLALRLLDSLKVVDEDSIDVAWTAEISARVDGLRATVATAGTDSYRVSERLPRSMVTRGSRPARCR